MSELTRNEFYKLSHACRAYAQRLALHDQQKVDRQLCLEWNEFQAHVQQFDLLRGALASLRPARPLTRRMVMGAFLLLSLLSSLLLAPLLSRSATIAYAVIWPLAALGLWLIPPARYGASVEQIEGKLLQVVGALQTILETNQLDLSEAVFFQVKEVLAEAQSELRQQVTLAHPGGI